MDLPQPPQDTDLRNIIDKLAQFVARNGPEFELMTKSKQKNNPKFSFLYGGEHFNYYQYKVTTEQAILKQVSDRRGDSGYTAQSGQFTMNQQPGPIMNIQQGLAMAGGLPVRPELSQWLSRHVLPEQNPTIPASLPGPPAVEAILGQQTVLQEQIKQSEANLNAQQAVLVQQQQSEIEKAVANEQAKMIQNLSDECNISLTEFDAILQPIIDSCTKDSISAGKGWILSHATTHDAGTVIAQYLLRTLTEISENFTQKLHIIYLVNDVLHHCARKNADDLKKCLETAVVPMFCNASIDVTEEQETKLNKLLKLWESKSNYFDSSVIDKMKDPTNSYQEYQTNLISQYANLITPLAQQSKTTFDNYQKQHQAFVAHTVRQIQQLEIQKQVLEGQVTMNQQMNPDQNTLMGQNNLANQVKQNQNFGPPGFTEPNMFTQQGPIPGNPMMPYDQPGFCNSNSNQSMFPPNELPPNEIGYGSSNGQQGNTNESGCYDFDHSYNSNNDAANNTADDAINELSINLSQPPPGFFTDSLPPSFQNGLPDLSKPPPGFNNVPEVCPEDLMPSVPYFELPAGLMVPLIMLEDSDYKPLDPDAIRLPPPAPPSERLLLAVDAFYSKPSHTRPQDREGWEKLGLYEYYKTKNSVRQQKEEDIRKGKRVKSRSPTPVQYDYLGNRSPPTRRYRSKSRSKSRERSRSKSPMIPRHRSVSPTERERSIGRRSGRRSRRSPVASPPPSMMAMTASPDRASPEMIGFKGTGQSGRSFKPSDRSPSPPGFSTGASFSNSSSQLMEMSELDPSNKGHQMLRKMGWGQGLGLGAAGQGIVAPIDAGSVRDHQDKYKGVGVNLNDPYENFRKNKGAAFITRMKERALERT